MTPRILAVGAGRPWEGRRTGARIRSTAVLRALVAVGPVDYVSLRVGEAVGAAPSPYGSMSTIDVGEPRPTWWRRLAWHGKAVSARGRLAPYEYDVFYDRSAKRATAARLRRELGHHDLVWVLNPLAAFFCPEEVLRNAVVDLYDLVEERYEQELALLANGLPGRGGGLARRRRSLFLRQAAATWGGWTRDLAREARLAVVVKDGDRERLGSANTVVIPNGTDIPDRPPRRAPGDRRLVVFVGLLHYVPNRDGVRWFVREVLPVLEALVPAVEVRLIGEACDEVLELDRPPRVRVEGYVEDLDRALSEAALAVVPLRMGSGTRLKVLEAFARRLPVVSTSVGCDGLDVVDGRHLLVADSPGDFARACAAILGDPGLAGGLASRAESLVRARYDWSIVEEQIKGLVEGMAT